MTITQELAPAAPLPALLEALLIIAADPMTEDDLAEATGSPLSEVFRSLHGLADQYEAQQRGFELRKVGRGWRFYSSATCAEVVTRFVTDGRQSQLSQAALETLAVIAYRQPVTRSGVGAIRGVNVDGVVRTLTARGLVEESGEDPLTGAARYRTISWS